MSGGTRSYEMARRLVAAGHEVHMITSLRDREHRGSEWFTTVEDGIVVHWKPVHYSNHMSYLQRIKAFFVFAGAASRKAATIDGDLVFATSTPLTIALPAIYSSWRRKVPMVFEVRDLWPELPIAMGALKNPTLRALARYLERWAYSKSSAVIALSPGMRDGVIRAGYPASQIVVIPNSSDNADFNVSAQLGKQFRASRPWLGDRSLLTYAGTFGRINGVGYIVDLAVAMRKIEPEMRFLLVGDGQERNAVEEKARSAGVLNVNLFMEPKMAKSEIPTLLSATTVAVSLFIDLPEMQANSANKFFDGLSAGRPILINYGGWQAEVLNKANAGFSVWRMSIEDAAMSIAARLQEPSWLETAGNQARMLANTQFDRNVLAQQFEATLLQVYRSDHERIADITSAVYPLSDRDDVEA